MATQHYKENKMNKEQLVKRIAELKQTELMLKQELLKKDGQIIFMGLDWIKEGLQDRSFDKTKPFKDLSIGYSSKHNRLTFLCDGIRFSCTAYCYDKVTVFFMEDVRKAEGNGAELMQDIILDKIISDAKVYGKPRFSGGKRDNKDIVEDLIALDREKKRTLSELSKNNEAIKFTKMSLKNQIIENSLDGNRIRNSLGVEYLAEIGKMAVTYDDTCPFMCKAAMFAEKEGGVFTNDCDVLTTSFASISCGTGMAKDSVFDAALSLLIAPYWDNRGAEMGIAPYDAFHESL